MLVHSISFKVVGITFKNEDEKDIQNEIKNILKEYKDNNYFDELYGGYTDEEIKEMDLDVNEYEDYNFPAKLLEDEYNDEDCFKIYIKTYNNQYVHIGYAPKKKINELIEWFTKEDLKIDGNIQITGGNYKSCEIYEEDYEEKERIIIKNFKYGAKITLYFYDSEITPKNMENEQMKEKIEKNQNVASTIQTIFWIIFIGIAIFIFIKIFSFINWLTS